MTATTLVAGTELDVLVAEKVMGWQRFPYSMPSDGGFGTIEHCPPGEVHVSTIRRVPNYSTDLADAWKVVEKIVSMNGTVEITACGSHTATPTATICEMYGLNGIGMETRIGHALADTMPLAVCDAALQAVAR